MSQLPLVYYPTTLFWVDDDDLFLEIATDRFAKDYAIQTALSPSDALCRFSTHQNHIDQMQFLRTCIEHEEYDLNDHLPVDINVEAIHALQDNPKKHDDIAVMIVDYNMPGMNGLELCAQLAHLPIKKILLTGQADFQSAISAFNQGTINYFICKDDPNIDVLLAESVTRLSMDYFKNKTQHLANHIESDYQLPQSDPAFAEFFQSLCKEKKIREFYLADKNGGMLLVDENNESHYLVIHSDHSLDSFKELYEQDNDYIFFMRSIGNRHKIPFFGKDANAWEVPVEQWTHHFYDPQILKGRETYYWKLIELNPCPEPVE